MKSNSDPESSGVLSPKGGRFPSLWNDGAASSPEELCGDANRIAAYLALDNFSAQRAPGSDPAVPETIALLGNQVVATLAAACSLARQFPSARLLFSGGVGHSTHLLYENLREFSIAGPAGKWAIHPSMTEAEMFARVAQSAFAIDSNRMLVEDRSTNTGENARFSLELLQSERLAHGPVAILQDPTMQRRSILTWEREAEKAGVVSPVLSCVAFVPVVEAGPDGKPRLAGRHAGRSWSIDRLLGLLAGEIQRLRDDEDGYGPRGRGFLPHVELPQAVLDAYLRLRKAIPSR
jgi:uncharacterized SAM-binding protein YcdF (DUF218 family)